MRWRGATTTKQQALKMIKNPGKYTGFFYGKKPLNVSGSKRGRN
jgi:hypothetical protein